MCGFSITKKYDWFPAYDTSTFVCHGSIPKSPGKASKINGFTLEKGVYYITTTPFLKAP